MTTTALKALEQSKPCGNKRPKSKTITALHKSSSSESKVKVGQEPMKRQRKPPSRLKRGIERLCYLDKVKKTEKKSDHNCFTALERSKPCGNVRPKSKAITALHNVSKRSQKEQPIKKEDNLIKVSVSNTVCNHEEVITICGLTKIRDLKVYLKKEHYYAPYISEDQKLLPKEPHDKGLGFQCYLLDDEKLC